MLEHYPHSGTQQMDGLMTPAVAQQAAHAQAFVPAEGLPIQNGMPQVPLEPLHPMANLVTSGFEAPAHRRSGSGSQVGVAPC